MRATHSLWQGILVLAVATVAAQAADIPPKTGWLSDFAAAQEIAQKHNRPILVHFHTTWCGPCKRMERDVLNSAEVMGLFESRLVGVKVDGDKNPRLRVKYNIVAYPTDLVLSPDGNVLWEFNGAQPKGQYLAAVGRFGPPAAPKVEAKTAVASTDTKTPASDLSAASEIEIGLESFCPVTLFKSRAWKDGRKEFACDYEGQRYYLAGPEEYQAFKAAPEKFAPRILGCDPVLLTDKSEAIPGTTKCAAYFEGALYLFKDEDSRKQFRADPRRFTRVQQVKVEGLKARG